MRRLIIPVAMLAFCAAALGAAHAQKEEPRPCVILKRMGPADQVTSHLYSFGIRGKQFQYVEGDMPKGVKFHGRLTDNDVRKIQNAGGKVVVMQTKYSEKEVEQARKNCASGGPDTPDSEEAAKPEAKPAAPAPAANPTPAAQPTATPAPEAPAPAPAQPAAQPAAPTASEDLATVIIKSTPDGADITVDGKFVGSTPSTVRLAPGDHTILIEKSGMKSWKRTMTASPGGVVTLDAKLEQQ